MENEYYSGWFKENTDEKGSPIAIRSREELNDFLKNWKNERLMLKTNFLGSRVSTVFLGLNHSYKGNEILCYETMIFGGPSDEYVKRYTTRSEARIGHENAKLIIIKSYFSISGLKYLLKSLYNKLVKDK